RLRHRPAPVHAALRDVRRSHRPPPSPRRSPPRHLCRRRRRHGGPRRHPPVGGRASVGAGPRVRAMADDFSLRRIDLHGNEVGYRMAGQGPAIVLVHGLALSSTTWRAVIPTLAERYTVIAPD